MKRPAFQFYPSDWRNDSALKLCSVAARGVWIEIMCIMHDCQPYGHLVINGQPMSIVQLSRLIGESEKVIEKCLLELEQAKVFEKTESGIIYSRRMVKDEKLRATRAESGRLGGNPNLLNQNSNQKSETKDNQIPTPSSSSSSSSSLKELNTASTETASREKAVLKKEGLKVNGLNPPPRANFDILQYLDDGGFAEARKAAPGWDVYHLASLFNENIRGGWELPKLPAKAFAGWCRKYTEGRPPA